jgi:hypothetical protein
MKERLRLLNQSTITTTNLQHLGHAMRFVSKTDFAFITTIEKKKQLSMLQCNSVAFVAQPGSRSPGPQLPC